MLPKILLLTFIGLTYGLTSKLSLDLGSQLEIDFDFPDFGEFRLPTVSCKLSSNALLNGWLTQTCYYKDSFLLKNFNLIVKAVLDEDGIVSCSLVDAGEDEEIKRKERECRKQCENGNEDTTTPSSNNEDTTPSGEGDSTTPSIDDGGSSPSSGGSSGEEDTTTPSTDEGGSSPSSGGSSGEEDTTTPSTDDESSNSSSGEGDSGEDGGDGSGSGKCKKGFTYIRAVDSCYIFSNYTAQWFDAECACASLGGTLVIINDEDEQKALTERIFKSHWIGLNDNKLEDEFTWRDGSRVSFTKWSPDGSLNTEEKNCVELSENYDFDWVTERCWEQRRFVCEQADSVEQITTPVCPEGWIFNEQNNFCYYVIKNKLEWAASKLLCSDIGGKLATFHNLDDLDFMSDIMSNVSENAWIGCQSDSSGRWGWSDSSSLDFTNWGSGEPKTSSGLISTLLGGGKKGLCADMDYENLFWSAKDCSTKQRAICKKEPEHLPRSECLEGWTFDGEGNCFIISSSDADYESSKNYCNLAAFGGILALPNTDHQNLFVADFLAKNSLSKVWAGVKVDEASSLNLGFLTGIINALFGVKDKNCIQIDTTGSWSAQSCDYKSKFMCSVPKFKSHFMEKLPNLSGLLHG